MSVDSGHQFPHVEHTGRQFPHVSLSLAPHTVTRGCLAEVGLEGEGLWPVKVSD